MAVDIGRRGVDAADDGQERELAGVDPVDAAEGAGVGVADGDFFPATPLI
ncbi:hypothetical protein ACFYR1_01030 [Streptomyces canus]